MSEIDKKSETEIAIEILKGLKLPMPVWWEEKSGCEYPWEYYRNMRINAIIKILEENQQREQGCEYCNNCKEIDSFHAYDVYIDRNNLIVSDYTSRTKDSIEMNYCPMCGRRLSHE